MFRRFINDFMIITISQFQSTSILLFIVDISLNLSPITLSIVCLSYLSPIFTSLNLLIVMFVVSLAHALHATSMPYHCYFFGTQILAFPKSFPSRSVSELPQNSSPKQVAANGFCTQPRWDRRSEFYRNFLSFEFGKAKSTVINYIIYRFCCC